MSRKILAEILTNMSMYEIRQLVYPTAKLAMRLNSKPLTNWQVVKSYIGRTLNIPESELATVDWVDMKQKKLSNKQLERMYENKT